MELDPSKNFIGNSYLFGMDPIWQISENKIIFLNSFKIKISIIFGIAHMFFGILLNMGNHVYFNEFYNVYTELFPQIIYFSSLFIYLIWLIFYKWIKYGPFNNPENGTSCAPSILLTFINMMLFKKVPTSVNCNQIYKNQENIQKILVFVAFSCIPWLFASKTFVLINKKNTEYDVIKKKKYKESFGDIVINQGVKTIEFVLGKNILSFFFLSLSRA